MSLTDLARLIGIDAETLQAGNLLPADGLRVWPGGAATVHHEGRVQLVVKDRRVLTVERPP
jgi:hypothetical protein